VNESGFALASHLPFLVQVNRDLRRKVQVNRIRTATIAALLASFVGLQPAAAMAQDRDRRDRYEDRWDRHEDRRDRQEDRRDRREDRWDRRDDRYDARSDYWDAARYYSRDDRRYGPRRLGRNDRIYRGSDSRYYCRRDDGTTGLIVGGISGGVLGNIIAPGGSKILGTIIGAGAGALIGRAIDDGDIVCR
jgi:Glycine zipper 2TM domain